MIVYGILKQVKSIIIALFYWNFLCFLLKKKKVLNNQRIKHYLLDFIRVLKPDFITLQKKKNKIKSPILSENYYDKHL